MVATDLTPMLVFFGLTIVRFAVPILLIVAAGTLAQRYQQSLS